MKKAASALFVSFKSARAIPCARPLRRDFMIQSTLDPGVRRIDFHPAVALDDRPIRTDAIVLHRDDGRFVVDFVDARLPEDPQGEGLLQIAFRQECAGIFAITAPDVGREPRMSAAREVWRHSIIAVNSNDRAQVLDALDREGPVPLRAFDGLVATSRDCEEVVYAMACEGSVDIDLSAGLDDGRAIVSGGSLGLRCRA
ncbi:MAG: hypothetical protein QHD01_16900 [Bradyrhizobium sp.]|uniref:hypothetical protein n=1 Tax=Bradyrhizobium sp. TaxID=376 RepID=UPI0029A283EE|nr:hypothetical protein [Bradyrhizobium sp.]MDX3968264.1 hypothetical protein [Bradyrhizobium sp.]